MFFNGQTQIRDENSPSEGPGSGVPFNGVMSCSGVRSYGVRITPSELTFNDYML